MYGAFLSGETKDLVMDPYLQRSNKVYNFIGTSFGVDAGMDMFSRKVQSRDGAFFSDGGSQGGGGGGSGTKGGVKSLRFDLVAIYDFAEKEALMMKHF